MLSKVFQRFTCKMQSKMIFFPVSCLQARSLRPSAIIEGVSCSDVKSRAVIRLAVFGESTVAQLMKNKTDEMCLSAFCSLAE